MRLPAASRYNSPAAWRGCVIRLSALSVCESGSEAVTHVLARSLLLASGVSVMPVNLQLIIYFV